MAAKIKRLKAALAAVRPDLLTLLRKRHWHLPELAKAIGQTQRATITAMKQQQAWGALIVQFGDGWGIAEQPSPGGPSVYVSRADGTYLFGFCGDTHIGSKYFRPDVLNDLYQRFAAAGVDRVFHAGNWIDGEARFNQHDLSVHGMDAQIAELIRVYPDTGLITYAVAGDDHEGWYGQREGIDIGRYAERLARDAGRCDWVHLGFMEAFVTLRHAKTNAHSQLLLMHAGGGSAYAHSYKPQKIVEGFTGGEKPAVVLIGHYHKLSQNLIRNVWAIQTGTTQDQTPFMRKKGIDAHVGGGICKLTQDASGAIVGCQVEFFAYYNRGYYNNRWSHGGKVNHADRGVQ